MFRNPFRVGQRAVLLALSISCGAALAHAQHHPHSPTASPAARHDRPSVHGMLVFGTEQVFASHLPMYHSPHDYQVLLELTLPDSVRAAYAASRRAFPAESVYTLEPERFVLPDMLRAPQPFRATLYRGHFERGGTAIGTGTVRIRQVLLNTPLRADAAPAAHPEFVLVGNTAEQFLVHRIEGRPDFDQVLRVQVADAAARTALQQRNLVAWQQAGPNRRQPLPAARATVRGRVAAGPRIETVQVLEQVYLEHGDLQ